jgi:hypothetical protein
MTAVFCQNAADRTAETCEKQLAPFSHLEFAVSDAAKGIAAAVERGADARGNEPSAPSLEHGLDVFPTAREANQILGRHWRHAEAEWDMAETADAKVTHAKQQGTDARGVAQTARAAWTKATASFAHMERLESAWGRVHATLDLFTPEGHLNDRARAEGEIATALKDLTHADWSKVRNFLTDPRSLTVLDRMHRRLETAEPRTEWRTALAWRWWLRHRRPNASDPRTALVRVVGRDRMLTEEEPESYLRVAAVLEDTFRASSAVACMNSVLRMQQSRHKRMSQPMRNLKRLSGNSRPFRSGPRKDVCPYQRLGLELPTYDFWTLLQCNPDELMQRLST